MYLGLDAWQLPNGFDILGTVIYRLVWDGTGDFELESMPLDFVRLKERHTGEYLANTVRQIIEKFGVQHKVSSSESLLLSFIYSFPFPLTDLWNCNRQRHKQSNNGK